jgi:hypothetical protein
VTAKIAGARASQKFSGLNRPKDQIPRLAAIIVFMLFQIVIKKLKNPLIFSKSSLRMCAAFGHI